MKLIELSKTGKKNKGKYFAMVDDKHYDWLTQWDWHAHIQGNIVYAERNSYDGNKRVTIKMHRFIIGVTDPIIKVDHKDWNGLNNQEQNIRLATNAQNVCSARKRKNTSSKYKGVSWKAKLGKWCAQICKDQMVSHIGYFNSEIEAAKAYDCLAIKYHGEFAVLNFYEPTVLSKIAS